METKRQSSQLGVSLPPFFTTGGAKIGLCSQLTASDINFSVVRPLVFKYARIKNMASIYACLVVKSYFLKESEEDMAYSGLNLSRAMLCEILATKFLGCFATNYIQLVAVLTTSWNPLAGAPPEIVAEVTQALGGDVDDIMNYPQSALEVWRPLVLTIILHS